MCEEMKIGILTFHRPINYGAFLQSYGLSQKISKDLTDVTVEVIDYIAPLEKKKIYINVLRRLKHHGLNGAFSEINKVHIFRRALCSLRLSERYICSEQLNELYDYIDKTYDVLIIGSDAVFNWKQNGFPTAFIPDHKFAIPVLTYAASVHGLHFYEEPKDRINKCGDAFEQMSAVFVRDECTRSFVNYCNNRIVVKHCCDPTFLIDFKQLYGIEHRTIEVLLDKYGVRRKYIVLMLQDEKISKEVYEAYAKDYTIVSLFLNNVYSDCFMYDLTPIEWCLVLKNAEVTITSYFHGTLLSLQQSTPAIAVDVSKYEGAYEGKLDDLLNRRLGLQELYYRAEQWDTNRERFFDSLNKCLSGKYLDDIRKGVSLERESYAGFITALNEIVEAER